MGRNFFMASGPRRRRPALMGSTEEDPTFPWGLLLAGLWQRYVMAIRRMPA